MTSMQLYLLAIFVSFSAVLVYSNPTNGTTKSPTSPPSTTPEPACNTLNDKCETCLKNPKCYWCEKPKESEGDTPTSCADYPKGDLVPTKQCALSDARWLVCWLNFEALLIAMGVIAGVLMISCCCCVYCCCCRSRGNKRKYAKEDAKQESMKEERKMRQEERRADRKTKNDEIRRKYGLMKDDVGYARFENS